MYIVFRLETVRSGFVLKRLDRNTRGSHSNVEQTNREKNKGERERKKKKKKRRIRKNATKNPDFTHLSHSHTLPPVVRGEKTNKQTNKTTTANRK